MNPESLAQLTRTTEKMLELLGAEEVSVTVKVGNPASPETSSRGGRTVVVVSVKDPERFIGKDGEHLRALNSVVRRLMEKQHGEGAPGFLIDIGGYHEAEAEKIRTGARVLAQRIRLFKHDIEMEPMTPYERLVVHELFADDPEIQTVSAGEGKFRHIVLKYGSAK